MKRFIHYESSRTKDGSILKFSRLISNDDDTETKEINRYYFRDLDNSYDDFIISQNGLTDTYIEFKRGNNIYPKYFKDDIEYWRDIFLNIKEIFYLNSYSKQLPIFESHSKLYSIIKIFTINIDKHINTLNGQLDYFDIKKCKTMRETMFKLYVYIRENCNHPLKLENKFSKFKKPKWEKRSVAYL